MAKNPLADAMAAASKELRELKVPDLSGLKRGTEEGSDGLDSCDRIPTGSIIVDKILGGGWPKGLLSDVHAHPGSGKTSLLLASCAQVQKRGKKALVLDFEHTITKDFAQGIGVWIPTVEERGEEIATGINVYENETFILLHVDAIQQGDVLLKNFLQNDPAIELVIIDSVAAMMPLEMMTNCVGDTQPGLTSRYNAEFFNKYTKVISRKNVALVTLNQMRAKLNFNVSRWQQRPEDKEQAAGGNALKFFASLLVEMSIVRSIKGMRDNPVTGTQEEGAIGNEVRVVAKKNKTAAPHVSAVFDLIFGSGPDNQRTIVNLAKLANFIEQRGSFFKINYPDGREPLTVKGNIGLNEFLAVPENFNSVVQWLEESGAL